MCNCRDNMLASPYALKLLGWSPVLAIQLYGTGFVFKVTDWTGGKTEKPKKNVFVGDKGFVNRIEEATLVTIGEGGIRGPQGPQGAQGRIGNTGPTGLQGPIGQTGPQGPTGTGTTGPQGPQGPSGIGTQGPQGVAGSQGSAGPQGAQGAQGPAGSGQGGGTQGPQGATGAQGPQGSTGASGSQGPQGIQGATGVGTQGPQGTQGVQGAPGSGSGSGTQGPQGTQGTQGVQGAQGPQGSQGATGTGLQGATGSQGPQGLQGAPGSGGSGGGNPDEEDITLSAGLLKFKNRPATTALGYHIIRERSGGVLTSADFPTNSIVEIRYDFNLGGANVTVPSNVTLKFNGGRISNGTLTGNSTIIDASPVQIFGTLSFGGTFKCDNVYSEWFGAITSAILTDGDVANIDTQATLGVMNSRPNTGPAINRALQFAKIASGEVKLLGATYKFNETLEIPSFVTLNLSENTVLLPILNGSGLLEGGSTPTISLMRNQFIPSSSMAKAIHMNTQHSTVKGRGMLMLLYCTYTIGVHLEAPNFGFGWTDMAWAPKVDLRIMGSQPYMRAADPYDRFGTVAPGPGTGGDVGEYYADTANRRYYRKESDGSWSFQGLMRSGYNTSVRVEANGNDYRIINADMNINDQYGYRGIEVIAINGGWINDSEWRGSVSNKISNFVSFYGPGAKLHHNMAEMTYQLDGIMTGECRVIYLEGDTGQNRFGYSWDLEYLPEIKSLIKYELGPQTYLNFVPYEYGGIKPQYLLDQGTNNKFHISQV